MKMEWNDCYKILGFYRSGDLGFFCTYNNFFIEDMKIHICVVFLFPV